MSTSRNRNRDQAVATEESVSMERMEVAAPQETPRDPNILLSSQVVGERDIAKEATENVRRVTANREREMNRDPRRRRESPKMMYVRSSDPSRMVLSDSGEYYPAEGQLVAASNIHAQRRIRDGSLIVTDPPAARAATTQAQASQAPAPEQSVVVDEEILAAPEFQEPTQVQESIY